MINRKHSNCEYSKYCSKSYQWLGANLITTEGPPVDNRLIFAKKTCFDGYATISFSILLIILISGMSRLPRQPGKAQAMHHQCRHQWPNPDIHRIPPSNASCKQPSASCAEADVVAFVPFDCCLVSVMTHSTSTELVKGQTSAGLQSRHGTHSTELSDALRGNTICYVLITGFASS